MTTTPRETDVVVPGSGAGAAATALDDGGGSAFASVGPPSPGGAAGAGRWGPPPCLLAASEGDRVEVGARHRPDGVRAVSADLAQVDHDNAIAVRAVVLARVDDPHGVAPHHRDVGDPRLDVEIALVVDPRKEKRVAVVLDGRRLLRVGRDGAASSPACPPLRDDERCRPARRRAPQLRPRVNHWTSSDSCARSRSIASTFFARDCSSRAIFASFSQSSPGASRSLPRSVVSSRSPTTMDDSSSWIRRFFFSSDLAARRFTSYFCLPASRSPGEAGDAPSFSLPRTGEGDATRTAASFAADAAAAFCACS